MKACYRAAAYFAEAATKAELYIRSAYIKHIR